MNIKNPTMRIPALAVVALATAFAIAGCGSEESNEPSNAGTGVTDTSAASAAPVSTYDAKLTEWAINPASPVLKAGNVKFTAVNDGKVPHEMVVLKTDAPADSLPVKDGRVSEDDSVGEIGELESGKSGKTEIDLKAGKYILVCNIAGHYEQGMYTEMTVK